jgi:AcrR family transcriptional regulator
MSPAHEPTSRRSRPAKPALSRELIVDTALRLLSEEGYDATSMRRVAQALDTGPASLYVYVANRDELLDLMLDKVISSVPLPEVDPARWRDQLKDVLRGMHRAMAEDYPGITRLALATIPTGPGALAATEVMVALMRAGGMPDSSIGYACDVLSLYVHAQALEASLFRERAAGREDFMHEYVGGVAAVYRALPADRYPNLAALVPDLMAGDGDQRFEAGLDVLINGLMTTPLGERLTHWF